MTDEATTAPTPGRATAATLGAIWLFLSYQQITALISDRFHLAVAVALVVLGVMGVAIPPVSRAIARGLVRIPAVVFVTGCAIVSAGISSYLARVTLNGQVFALDSSVYLFQARALSHLGFGADVPSPYLPFGARFLFSGPTGALYGVFPPGYPLFLAPFVALGAPLAAGPVTAALLVVASWALARELSPDDEFVPRLALLLALPSFPRAIETADLLSHALLAALSAFAIALALRARKSPKSVWCFVGIGVCVGWATASRLLDGVVLGVFALGVLVHAVREGRIERRALVILALSALPFAVLLLANQRAATGSFSTPTQSEYFVRSDWPTTCHRLGFGEDVGCVIEHPGDRVAFGPDGYGADDAVTVMRSRTTLLGYDLFGAGALALAAFAGVIWKPRKRTLLAAGFAVALTLAYGLFYYGNAPVYGARHLFPAAPFLYALLARAAADLPSKSGPFLDRAHVLGASVLALVGVGFLGQVERWRQTLVEVSGAQKTRGNLRSIARASGVTRGIVMTPDTYSYIAAYDGRDEANRLLFVNDDGSGEIELRRRNPDLPLYVVKNGALVPVPSPPIPPGIYIEMESAWPSYVKPHGLAVRRLYTPSNLGVPSSGGQVLAVFVSSPGLWLDVPFDVATEGRYSLRLDGLVTPNGGRYDIYVDGRPIAPWNAYGPKIDPQRGPSTEITLARGHHVLRAVCAGKDERSSGYVIAFDTLIGEPLP